MTGQPNSHKQSAMKAMLGLVFVLVGLVLAVLSNPARFSIKVQEDQYIRLLAVSGFFCTLAGSLLFLYSVRSTTKSMPEDLERKANFGVGLGFALHFLGFFLPEIAGVTVEMGIAIVLLGLATFVWGTMHYALGKGYSKSLGWLGLFGILGLIVLVLLPHSDGSYDPSA